MEILWRTVEEFFFLFFFSKRMKKIFPSILSHARKFIGYVILDFLSPFFLSYLSKLRGLKMWIKIEFQTTWEQIHLRNKKVKSLWYLYAKKSFLQNLPIARRRGGAKREKIHSKRKWNVPSFKIKIDIQREWGGEKGKKGGFSSRAWGPWGMELDRRRRVEEGGCRQDQRAVLVRAFEARGGRVAARVDR